MNINDSIRIIFGADKIGKIHHWKEYRQGITKHGAEFRRGHDERICMMMGTANQGNMGDLAIAEAEMQILHDTFPGKVIEVETRFFWEYALCMKRYLRKGDLICLQGGGNLNEWYPGVELERCAIVSMFPNICTVLMPQTLSYKNGQSALLRNSQKVYGRHRDFHMFARDRRSYELMKQYYTTIDVNLVPDIVLSLDIAKCVHMDSQKRSAALLTLRHDVERQTSDEAIHAIKNALQNQGMPLIERDTEFAVDRVPSHKRQQYLSDFFTTLYSSRLMITDRLHGMVFAALTNTPCLVMPSSDHKIKGVYEWIKDLPTVRFTENVDELVALIPHMLSLDLVEFPRQEMLTHYEPLLRLLK